MFVVAGVRSKFGAFVLMVMVATTVYLLIHHQVGAGIFMVAATLFIYGRVPAAIGAYLGSRNLRSK
jgi:hypothetical protein